MNPTITPKELEDQLKTEHNLELVDVREDDEVAAGKIPEAKHIKLGDLPERFSELDKNKQVIMICRSGRRSDLATEFLREQGYDATNMTGGMLEWEGDVD